MISFKKHKKDESEQIPGLNEFINRRELFNSFDKEYQEYLSANLKLEIEKSMNDILSQIERYDKRLENLNKDDDAYKVNKYDRDTLQLKYNVYAELHLTLSKDISKFEEVEWTYNNGHLRTEDEVKRRDDYFIYTTRSFRHKATANSDPIK